MKQIINAIAILLIFSSCKDLKISEKFVLLPTVKHINYNGKSSNFNHNSKFVFFSETNNKLPVLIDKSINLTEGTEKNHNVSFIINSDLDIQNEGYFLNIHKENIEIIAKDYAGLFYSFNTLRQLIKDSKDQSIGLPIVSIKDYPSLSYRSIHIDVKHHTEKKDYYFKLIDQLSSIKINGIIIEFEDKLGYQRRPSIAAPDSYSISWWRSLCEYANERNIKISPLIQGLGHASFILKHDKYKKLRDINDDDWAFNPTEPETYEIQFDLYKDAMEATPFGQFLHVGGDEVKVIDRDGKKGFELNLLWLNKVSEFAKQNNRIPIFWDDMYLKHGGVWMVTRNTKLNKQEVDSIWISKEDKLTEFLDDFPKNCIYMRWNYFSPWAEGNLKTIDWYKENNLKVMGATAGQTRWILMPQDYSNIESIKSFALNSVDKNLDGLLLTLWDDDSPHFELYKRGIYAFANYTWSGNDLKTEKLKNKFNHRFFSPFIKKNNFIDNLDNPVRDWANLFVREEKHRNQISKNKNSINSHIISLPAKKNKGEWSKKYSKKIQIAKKHSSNLNSILKQISKLKTKTLRNKYTLDIYEQVAKLSKFSYDAFLTLNDFDKGVVSSSKLLKLEDKFSELRIEFENTYSKTRNINKPNSYYLDQDHHNHTANQSLNMDWQFIAELKLFEKIKLNYEQNN
ncbi:beta-N-acetylhexosaminidase [Flavobacteriales bacterium]|nr:beta-N-acetylhexosaminidase [Flavobacteriales bacterium]